MAITVSEKQHWKDRIARKISLAVEALLEKSNPHYLREVTAAAHKQAASKLGIEELLNELDRLEREVTRIRGEEQATIRQLMATIRGADVKSVSVPYGWREEVDRAIKTTQQAIEKDLLAADALGRQVLKLRREEEELLDTVWLATSPQQVRSLWQSVAELLASEVTPLQQQALSTPPPEGSAK